MGPFRELFDGLTFAEPHTPVYCCSTGDRFPTDPAAMRELAVNQWVRPLWNLLSRLFAVPWGARMTDSGTDSQFEERQGLEMEKGTVVLL